MADKKKHSTMIRRLLAGEDPRKPPADAVNKVRKTKTPYKPAVSRGGKAKDAAKFVKAKK